MKDELKPCPFCGSLDIKTQSGTGLDLMTQYNGKYVYCNNCKVFKQVKSYHEWSTRPDTPEKVKAIKDTYEVADLKNGQTLTATHYLCGNCNEEIHKDYICCPYCGKQIDWNQGE